jgi:glycosyltransferase involved in cell wall biosynthesis
VIPTKDEGRKEGMPIAPLEAMSSGRIVLGSNVSGIKDILESYKACLFQPANIVDLMKKIRYIKNLSINEREIIANSMRLYVERVFSVEAFINKHDKFYRNFVK